MNGGTRCKPKTKNMIGDKVTVAEDEKDRIPNLRVAITEKPSKYPEMTKLPVCKAGLDLYTQARKALSFRSPFDSEESPASESVILGANNLPGRVSGLLGRHSDSRKRHKRVHSGSEKKKKKSSAPGKSKGGSIWVQIEDYFRELSVEDVELIDKLCRFGSPREDSEYFRIPSLDADDRLHERYEALNRKLAGECGKIGLPLQNMVWLDCNGKVEVDEGVVEEEDRPRPMDVDIEKLEEKEVEVKEEKSNEARRENNGKETSSFGAVEWLLGSRNKTYLASERPSKKRKLLGRDAGLQKLLVAHPVEGLESVCHNCGFGDTTDPLNCLIKCASCGMVVHQWCYGVHDDVDSSWLCSWCKASSTCEASCFLCSKKGGALKPVQNERCESENDVTEVKFSHLFCCQWIPEVYVENTRTMEPVMNMDKVKDPRKKLLCYLCKVKCGACVRCSSGSCRTSFHPICAREARHRMEIWGKLGCDEIELRAFCSKHSEVHCDDVRQDSGDISLTGDLDHRNPNDYAGGDLHDDIRNFESHPECGDVLHSSDRVEGHCDISTCNLIMILKKLIDLGRANAADVASDIGISPELLKSVLVDNHVVPELQGKLMVWLKERAQLKVKISSPSAPGRIPDSEGVRVVPADESGAVPFKSVPPRRRTKSHLQFMKDGNSWSSKDKSSDCTADGDLVSCLHEKEDSDGPFKGSPASDDKKVEVAPGDSHYSTTNNSAETEAEMQSLVPCLSEDGIVGESRQPLQMGARSPVQKNVAVSPASSYIHPFIYAKLLENSNGMLERTLAHDAACPRGNRGSHQLEASSSAGLCCKRSHNLLSTSGDLFSEHDGVNLDQLVKARDLVMLKMSPENEVEGELIYYQQKLLSNALARKHISDNLILEVVKNLPLEIDIERQRKWDSVMVTQYNHELREARKQGRKERKHKEAQAILAAATAAAASSSRISSVRKDTLEEYPNQMMNHGAKDTIFGSAVTRSSSEFPKDHPRTCDVCSRSGTILNPVLVCSSCKVAVHLDCYCSVKSTTGPWLCELCEELLSARGSTNYSEKPYTVAECVLCGGTAGAFRKSVDGRWIHAFCAEWVLEPTYRRGQVANIEGLVADSMGSDTCSICHRKQGVCLKCSYGHCQSMFHPTCARSAGFYMTKRTNGGKLQHKAYCEKHSVDQKAKVDTQKHGVEEFKSLKQVRVELERLRLLCERIAKREKLKREIVLCSHEILATSRDSLLLTLGRHPYYQQAISSESGATSDRGYTDDGEIVMQRSDGNITVDSTVAGKRRVKIPISTDNDKKTDDSSTLRNPYTLKPGERKSFSGKQIPQRVISLAQRNNLTDDVEKQSNSIIK